MIFSCRWLLSPWCDLLLTSLKLAFTHQHVLPLNFAFWCTSEFTNSQMKSQFDGQWALEVIAQERSLTSSTDSPWSPIRPLIKVLSQENSFRNPLHNHGTLNHQVERKRKKERKKRKKRMEAKPPYHPFFSFPHLFLFSPLLNASVFCTLMFNLRMKKNKPKKLAISSLIYFVSFFDLTYAPNRNRYWLCFRSSVLVQVITSLHFSCYYLSFSLATKQLIR